MSRKLTCLDLNFLVSSFFISLVLCGPAYASQSSPGKGKIGDFSIPFVRNVPTNKSIIVFVHGLIGNAKSTWSDGTHYWPAMLRDDPAFGGQNIYVYEYPTPLLGKSFSVDQLADNMRLVLSTDGVLRHDSITFVSHSMGGLITRAFILKYRQSVAPKIRLLYFFATPTTGSPYAKLAALVSRNQQFGELYPMSTDTDNYLGTLQSGWLAANLGLRSYCGYETIPTHGFIIVERQSATNLCSERLDSIDADHISIVKPSSPSSTPYRALKSAIQETMPVGTSHDHKNRRVKVGSPDEVVVHPYDLSNDRRTRFLSLLKPGEGEHDILRIGCVAWSDSSCVAAGKFLLLFSEAGWAIDSNRVFRAEPMVPIEGMGIVTRGEGELPKLPPHLGTWEKMNPSETKIWKAFRKMGIPVSL